jgi:hypothetical protein
MKRGPRRVGSWPLRRRIITFFTLSIFGVAILVALVGFLLGMGGALYLIWLRFGRE